MSTHWCYTRDGRTSFGPVTWQELRQMAEKGELLPTDVVGHVGMPRSMRAGTVPGLFAPEDQPTSSGEILGTGVNIVGVPYRLERSGSR